MSVPLLMRRPAACLTEMTASECVRPYLEEGTSTVGTRVDMAHSDSTPEGLDVECTVELIEVDRRRLVFSAEVRDPFGVVASGTHERFVVDNAKFMEKARRKLRSD